MPNETRIVKSLEHHSVSLSFQTFEVANKAALLTGGCKQRAEYTVWKCREFFGVFLQGGYVKSPHWS